MLINSNKKLKLKKNLSQIKKIFENVRMDLSKNKDGGHEVFKS